MNTKHAIVSLGIVCAALWGGSGCTNPIAPITTPQEVIPLKVGNEWNYEVANYLPAFNDTLYRQFTSQVIRDTVIDGKTHFVHNTVGGIFISSIVTNLSDGYYVWRSGKYRLVTKYPVKLGDKYQRILIDYQFLPVDTLTVEIIDLNKSITVKAGTFQCYTEQYYLSSFKYQTFIAVGYGTVQELIFDSTNTLVARVQLTSYTIQK